MEDMITWLSTHEQQQDQILWHALIFVISMLSDLLKRTMLNIFFLFCLQESSESDASTNHSGTSAASCRVRPWVRSWWRTCKRDEREEKAERLHHYPSLCSFTCHLWTWSQMSFKCEAAKRVCFSSCWELNYWLLEECLVWFVWLRPSWWRSVHCSHIQSEAQSAILTTCLFSLGFNY